MKSGISLVIILSILAAAVFSGGCTVMDPGETLYLDELYGDNTPDMTPDSLGYDPEPLPGNPDESPVHDYGE